MIPAPLLFFVSRGLPHRTWVPFRRIKKGNLCDLSTLGDFAWLKCWSIFCAFLDRSRVFQRKADFWDIKRMTGRMPRIGIIRLLSSVWSVNLGAQILDRLVAWFTLREFEFFMHIWVTNAPVASFPPFLELNTRHNLEKFGSDSFYKRQNDFVKKTQLNFLDHWDMPKKPVKWASDARGAPCHPLRAWCNRWPVKS